MAGQTETQQPDEPGGRTLAARGLWALTAKVGGTGLAFALQVALARWLGKEGFGAYILAFTWMGLAVLLSKQGLDSAASRFLPSFRGADASSRRESLVASSRRRVFAVALALAGLGGVVLVLAGERIGPELRATLIPFLLLIPVLSLAQLESGILQALGRIRASQFPLLVGVPAVALAAVGLAWGLGRAAPRPALAATLYTAAGLVALLLLTSQRRRVLRAKSGRSGEDTPWFGVGRSLLLSAGFGLVLTQADVLMLGAIAGSAATGPYAAATRIARLLALPLIAGEAVLAPRIAALHAARRRQDLERLVRRASLAMAGITLPLLVAIAALRTPVLDLLGPGFDEAAAPLLLLLVGQGVNTLLGAVGALMTMTGGHATAARILGGCALLNLAANAILIPRLGPLGAAWATMGTTVLWNAAMYASVRRRLGVRPSFF